jgi:hypothetical protein
MITVCFQPRLSDKEGGACGLNSGLNILFLFLKRGAVWILRLSNVQGVMIQKTCQEFESSKVQRKAKLASVKIFGLFQ